MYSVMAGVVVPVVFLAGLSLLLFVLSRIEPNGAPHPTRDVRQPEPPSRTPGNVTIRSRTQRPGR
jgi:hypothetical protein